MILHSIDQTLHKKKKYLKLFKLPLIKSEQKILKFKKKLNYLIVINSN